MSEPFLSNKMDMFTYQILDNKKAAGRYHAARFTYDAFVATLLYHFSRKGP